MIIPFKQKAPAGVTRDRDFNAVWLLDELVRVGSPSGAIETVRLIEYELVPIVGFEVPWGRARDFSALSAQRTESEPR